MLPPLVFHVMLVLINPNFGPTSPLNQKPNETLLWKSRAPLKTIHLPGLCQRMLKTIASDVPLKHTKLKILTLFLIVAENQFQKAFNTITTGINLLVTQRNPLNLAPILDNNLNLVPALAPDHEHPCLIPILTNQLHMLMQRPTR